MTDLDTFLKLKLTVIAYERMKGLRGIYLMDLKNESDKKLIVDVKRLTAQFRAQKRAKNELKELTNESIINEVLEI